ncbi:MAG: hypothetical protein Q9M92_06980 [Enterobacterales bacterium]|nr:hypothetical protein [Enterobacterales bacterium]
MGSNDSNSTQNRISSGEKIRIKITLCWNAGVFGGYSRVVNRGWVSPRGGLLSA